MINLLLLALALPCFAYFAISHLCPRWVATHKTWWREAAGAVGALALLVPLIEDIVARQHVGGGGQRFNWLAIVALAIACAAGMRLLGVQKALGEPKTIAITIAIVGASYLALFPL